MEILTLAQTQKLDKKIVIVLYGSDYLEGDHQLRRAARYGMISEADLSLFEYADTPEQAFEILHEGLTRLYLDPERPIGDTGGNQAPSIAKTRI